METAMTTAQYPVLPIAAGTLARVFAALVAPVVMSSKAIARALRHRREANVLARLDRHMLADIGITRTDVRDAFSAPVWEDPTALLSDRVNERRHNRPSSRLHDVPATGCGPFPQPAHRRALPMI
jgi:uncharacterized protein YjiS (DUF1127 family)